MKEDKLYLIHIDECIVRIEQFIINGEKEFFEDIKTQDAVLRNLHTLSESTQHLSTELKAKHPEIDWRGISGLRNVLVHDYLGISIIRIWEIVSRELPALKSKIKAILQEKN